MFDRVLNTLQYETCIFPEFFFVLPELDRAETIKKV